MAHALRQLAPRLGGRVPLLHVKDGPALAAGSDAGYYGEVLQPIGSGALDMPAVLTANPAVRWHIVELETLAMDVFAALEQSYSYMVGHGFSAGRRAVGAMA
jgi:hypothetical protein